MDLFCYLVVFRDCLCYTVLSVPCSLVVSCCQKPNLLALLCVTFSCFFFHFPIWCPGSGAVHMYLIVSISDICLLPNFDVTTTGLFICTKYTLLDGLNRICHLHCPNGLCITTQRVPDHLQCCSYDLFIYGTYCRYMFHSLCLHAQMSRGMSFPTIW